MQYYYGVIPVNQRYLMHANSSVDGYTRVVNGKTVKVRPYTRLIKSVGNLGGAVGKLGSALGRNVAIGYKHGYSGKTLNPRRQGQTSTGYKMGRAAVEVGHFAGRASRTAADGIDTVYKKAKSSYKDATVGYKLGRNGTASMRGQSFSTRAGYAAGRAARAVSNAASNIKEFGSKQIKTAKSFLGDLFGKASGLVNKAITNLKSIAGKDVGKGRNFMGMVFEAAKEAKTKAKETSEVARNHGRHGDRWDAGAGVAGKIANQFGLAELKRKQSKARNKYGWINADRTYDDGPSTGRGRR